MIIAIADDITGAAEIAGLGFAHGMTTALFTEVPETLPDADLMVLATDTRSLSEEEAVAATSEMLQQLKNVNLSKKMLTEMNVSGTRPTPPVFFKKTDPLLRGHVVPELRAIMRGSRYNKVLYVPANTSMGHIIRGGRFFINGEPIDQTPLEHDTEFPVQTSSICLLLGISAAIGIRISDVENDEDMRNAAQSALNASEPEMLAGGSDLFTAMIRCMGFKEKTHKPFEGLEEKGAAIMVCGSVITPDLTSRPFIRRHHMPIASMPREVFEGAQTAEQWINIINARHLIKTSMQPAYDGIILNIPYESSGSRIKAARLRMTMAVVTKSLIERLQPTELVLEGGATAFAVIKELGLKHLTITDQVEPGVVRMSSKDIKLHITFKPGGYPWGKLLV